jgi:DNA polymerase-3 subunit delta
MADKAPRVLGSVVLVTGSAEFLAERVVDQARAALLDDDPAADLTDVEAVSLDLGTFVELISPSLFAANRGVVVRGIDALPEPMHDPLVTYAGEPAAEVALVLVHPGGQRGKQLLDRLRAAGVREVKAEAPKPWQVAGWLTAEARSLGSPLDQAAADALIGAVGADLRTLAASLAQLVADHPGRRLDADLIRGAFEGRAEVKSFDIADRAIAGDVAGALELLRWALAQRVPLPLVTSAFALSLRRLVKLSFAPGGLRDADLAREVGCSPYQLKRLRAQARGWSADGWASAVAAVADADAAIKGAGADGGHALESMVLAVAAAGPAAPSPLTYRR